MPIQIAESVFRSLAKEALSLAFIKKFQTQPLAHRPNEADFMISHGGKLHFVEVKECGDHRFSLIRFTQMEALNAFTLKGNNHYGWLFIYYRKKMKKESNYFCLPVSVVVELKEKHRSLSEEMLTARYSQYKNILFWGEKGI